MLSQEWILLFLIAGTATALPLALHQTGEESLKSALEAVTRKQRSLDTNTQEYYNDLHSFKYHGGEPERKFERDHQNDREIDEDDEEIVFLPNAGQLETVGNGFQGFNNKLLERVLMDYLETEPEQEGTVTSWFRERERSSSRKRGNSEHPNVDNKELAKLVLEELQDGSPYSFGDMDDEEYMNTLQTLYDRYRAAGRGNKLYDSEGPMSWGDLVNKESLMRGQSDNEDSEFPDRDQSVLYVAPAERRNVNGRYPIGRDFRTFHSMAKRYPVAKRSPKPLPTKKQITDPKVVQDLGALFGTQSTDDLGYTHDHDHEHDHSHDQHHDQHHDHDEHHNRENSTEAPQVTPAPKGQKENATKVGKAKSIEVRKKSVDWSQYFGIDRRKKKSAFLAGQGTQNQDDEWMLQRYYESMAENLKPAEREYEKDTNERKDKLEQMDSKLKNIKDLIIEEALRYADSGDGVDLQKVKDKVMARMAAAYSLEKMRKALSDLRSNVAARIEAQKAAHAESNQTSNSKDGGASRSEEKRSGNTLDELKSADDPRTCPELEAIEKRCKTADNLAGDGTQVLFVPCVMLQICKACVEDDLEDECLVNYVMSSGKVCLTQEGQKAKADCAKTAVILSKLQPPTAVAMQCRMNGNDSCLRRTRLQVQYGTHYPRYPYAGHRFNAGSDLAGSQAER